MSHIAAAQDQLRLTFTFCSCNSMEIHVILYAVLKRLVSYHSAHILLPFNFTKIDAEIYSNVSLPMHTD